MMIKDVTVVGANAAVLSWPASAKLESIGIVPNKMQIRTSGTESWRAIDINVNQDSNGDGNPANDPDQGGTLWVFERINGRWYASGAERLRPYQLNGDKPVADPTQGGLSTLIGNGWLYDANRWGPMAGVNPQPGDIVGFMISSGSTRLDYTSAEQQRTDIIACRWPDAGGQIPFDIVWREGQDVAQPEAPPIVPPVSPTEPGVEVPGTAVEGFDFATAFNMVNEKLDAQAREIAALRADAQSIAAALPGWIRRIFGF